MILTFDHILYLTGIGIGVLLTIIGIILTEHIKNRRHTRKLTISFKYEVLDNFNKTNFNLSLLEEEHSKSRQPFHLDAFQQLKLEVYIDWSNSELCDKIYTGFTFAEEYNKRVPCPEKYEEEMSDEKVILEEIRNSMFFIDQKIKDSYNITKAIKKDTRESKKKGWEVGNKIC
jgi:hypothetical protein